MFSELIHILSFIFYLYLAVSTLYFLVLAVAGKFFKQVVFQTYKHKKKIAVLIPAYREDDIIVHTVQKACRQNYPEFFFKVVVIADSLTNQTLEELRLMPIRLLEAKFEISTKAKSLNIALQSLVPDQFEVAVILDADNIMSDDFLEKINSAIHNGYKAIQCRRLAKNKDNPVAMLGAVSEEININLFRRGQVALGFSAAPLGSGMAFDFNLLKEIFSLSHILENAGEDREIDIQLLKRKIFMHYTDDAYVFDEKVSNSRGFERQRVRWFEAQWNNARRFFKPDMMGEPKTIAYFNKFFQTLVLPRLLYFTVFILFFLVFVFQQIFQANLIYPSIIWWIACLTTYIFVLFISIPSKYFTVKLLKAMVYIPVLMIFMVKAVLKMKDRRKGFIHTSKSFVEK